MSRPRQASDEEILKAAFRAIARFGPGRLTLSDVAREAGVTAPALVQRFGSKRALLLAAAADVATGGRYLFPDLRARHASPVAALVGLADCMALLGASPEAVAHTLAFQQLGAADPEFRRHSAAAARGMRAGILALVQDAIGSGELARCSASRLASAIHAVLNGAPWNWLAHREGSMVEAIRRDLATVLAPYRTAPRERTEAGRRPPSRGRPRSRPRPAS